MSAGPSELFIPHLELAFGQLDPCSSPHRSHYRLEGLGVPIYPTIVVSIFSCLPSQLTKDKQDTAGSL